MTFDGWYEPGGSGSGDGSGVEYTAGYRLFLERFMCEHDIRSVLDVGCGDWQFSKLIDWGDVLYIGVDVVPSLAHRLNAEHGSYCRRFSTVGPDNWPTPPCDLAIVKDVMIHLPNEDVQKMIRRVEGCHHKLFVNDFSPAPNVDCERGHYRPLDLTAPPFGLVGEVVYRFPRIHNADKIVLHVKP